MIFDAEMFLRFFSSAISPTNKSSALLSTTGNIPQVLINTLPNNIHIACTNPPGHLVFKLSSGTVGLTGTSKCAPKAAYLLIDRLSAELKQRGMERIRLNFRGVNGARALLVTQIRKMGVVVTEVMDSTRIPFNGTRPRKSRRI